MTDFEEIKAEIESRLPEYLEHLGISPAKESAGDSWFRCLNPDHDDSDPSMHYVPGSDHSVLKCFSCGASYDIFDIANIYEDKPVQGPGFVSENMMYLADLLGIEATLEPSEKDLAAISAQKTYEAAAKVLERLFKQDPELAFAETRKRGLKDATALQLGIGVCSFTKFIEEISSQGEYSEEWLAKVGIDHDFIGKDRLTFVLRDHKGQAVGLARRELNWTKESRGPKYKNTDSSKNPAYNKSRLLYGMHTARQNAGETLVLVEGYFDQAAFMQEGFRTAVAVCGTSITKEHAKLIKECGFQRVKIALDGDDAGIKATEKHLFALDKSTDLEVSAVLLPYEADTPKEDRDPASWVAKYGIKNFNNVESFTAFEWRMRSLLATGMESHDVAKEMVEFIAKISSHIERDRMARRLSELTSVPVDSILEELKDLTNSRAKEAVELGLKKISMAKSASEQFRIIEETKDQLELAIIPPNNTEITSEASLVEVSDILSSFNQEDVGLDGWDTMWEPFNEHFGGMPKQKELIAFGGNPNTGKSTLLYNICNGLISSPANRGLSCAFLTLDDPVDSFLAKMLAIKTRKPINWCRYAAKHMASGKDAEAYAQAQNWLRGAVADKRLIPKGIKMGDSPDIVERWIDNLQQETGNDVVLFVDSFHNMTTHGEDERIKYKRLSEWSQKMSDSMGVTIVCTMECNKMAQVSGRPHIEHLGESSKMAFAFKLVGMVYNELHEKRDSAQTLWVDEETYSEPRVRPILECNYEKNKITAFKGTHYFKFYDEQARLEPVSLEEVEELRTYYKSEFRSKEFKDDYNTNGTKPGSEAEAIKKVSFG